MTAATWLMLAVQASIFSTVVALGLRARFRDATSLFRRPGALSRALLAMYVLMPALALLLVLAFGLKPVVGVVLVAVSLAPVPPLLPRKSDKAGGDPTYGVSLLATAAVLSIVVIPAGLHVVKAVMQTEARADMGHIVKTVLASVLLPLTLGMTLRWRFPRFAARAAKPVATIGLVLLAATVPFLFVSAWSGILSLVGDGTLLATALFVIVGLAAGHLIGGPDPHERAVLALASGARHPGVAMGIGMANFAEPKLVMAAVLLYLVVAVIVAIPYVAIQKKTKNKIEKKRRRPFVRDFGYR